MRSVQLHAPGDVRVEDVADPVIRVAVASVCGSDLWPNRGVDDVGPKTIGHEYIGTMEQVGDKVRNVAVACDDAVGILSVLAAQQICAERIIITSRHANRAALTMEFGATDVVEERGDDFVARVKELTNGIGTQESIKQVIQSILHRGHVGYVGISHDVTLPRHHAPRHRPLRLGCAPARRPGPGAAFSARTDSADLGPQTQPRQGLRPHAEAGANCSALPRHGRAPCYQGLAPAITS